MNSSNRLSETFSNSSLDFLHINSYGKDILLLSILILTIYYINCLSKHSL
jgi:hypothetical protein